MSCLLPVFLLEWVFEQRRGHSWRGHPAEMGPTIRSRIPELEASGEHIREHASLKIRAAEQNNRQTKRVAQISKVRDTDTVRKVSTKHNTVPEGEDLAKANFCRHILQVLINPVEIPPSPG